jgi:parvulin-like peptidyl-prolyl isomerase
MRLQRTNLKEGLMRRFALAGLLTVCAVSAYAKEKPQAKPKDTDVLATVNGTPITRGTVVNRLWSLHANDVLNQIVDETIVAQAMAAWQAKMGPTEKESVKSTVDIRFQRVKAQFLDDAAFNANLQNSGVTLEAFQQQLESQVAREMLLMSAKNLSVSPKDASDFFQANKERLGSPEAVHLRHILVSTDQQAKDLLVAIRVGADFSKLAREISLDAVSKEKGGDLGFVSRGMLQADIEKVVFGLKIAEVSEPVKGPLGYHLFKVEETRPAMPAVFNTLQDDITRALLAQKITQAWPDYLQELRASAKVVPAPGVSYTPAAQPKVKSRP